MKKRHDSILHEPLKKRTVLALFAVAFFLSSSISVFGQTLTGHWEIIRSDSDYLSSDLYALAMRSPVYGVAVGGFGTMRITRDSGATWRFMKLPTEQTLRAAAFLSDAAMICVGDSGVIYESADSGGVWQALNSGVTTQLNGVAFADANTGVAVGANGVILRTTNGGAEWSPQSSGISGTLYAVAFMGKQIAVAVGGSGTVLRSTNGGTAWTRQNSGVTARLTQLSKIDSTTLFAAGDSWAMLRTTDAGADWKTIKFDSALVQATIGLIVRLRAFAWADTAVGCVCIEFDDTTGNPPSYFRYTTSNGGASWNTIHEFGLSTPYTGINLFVRAMQYISVGKAIAAGDNSFIAVTYDSGTAWLSLEDYIGAPGYGTLSFSDPQNGYVVAGSDIKRTRDSGFTWATVYNDTTYPNRDYVVNDIASPVPDRCIAVGRRDTVVYHGDTVTDINYPPAVIHTTNNGETWQRTILPRGGSSIGSKIAMDDSLHGVIGAYKVLYHTTNGGETWDTAALPSEVQDQAIAPVFCVAPNTYGAIVETYPDSAFFIKTADDGRTWRIASLPIFHPGGIVFTDSLNGWIAGAPVFPSDTVIIYHTSDGGKTWALQFNGIAQESNSVYMLYAGAIAFADKNNGIVGGTGVLVMRTTNGGATWLLQNTGVDDVGYIAYPSYKYAVAGNSTGYLLRYTGDTPLAVREQAPESAGIDEQVYPVPSRQPDVTIRFAIPKRSAVELYISDEAGRKIETAFAGTYRQGEYVKTISFRALPAGKYYATLVTGGIAETKAIIVLK